MNRSLLVGLGVAVAGLLGFLIYWFFFHNKGGGGDKNPGNLQLAEDGEGNWVVSWDAPANKGTGTGLEYKWQVTLGSTETAIASGTVPDPTTSASFPQHNENGAPLLLPGTTYEVTVVASSSAGDSQPARVTYSAPPNFQLDPPVFTVSTDGTNVTQVFFKSDVLSSQDAAALSQYVTPRKNTLAVGSWATYDSGGNPVGSGSFPTLSGISSPTNVVLVTNTSAPWTAPPAAGYIVFSVAVDWPFCGTSPTCPSSSGKWGRPSVAPGPVTSIVFSPNA